MAKAKLICRKAVLKKAKKGDGAESTPTAFRVVSCKAGEPCGENLKDKLETVKKENE